MQVRLVVSNQESQEFVSYDLSVKEKIILGRHVGSPVFLQGEGLSRHHFSLMPVDGDLHIEDLSSNGTWLNGVLLKGQPSAPLSSGAMIEVPGYEIRVLVPDPASVSMAQAEAPALFVPAEIEPNRDPSVVKASVAKMFEPSELALLFFAALSFVLISFLLNS